MRTRTLILTAALALAAGASAARAEDAPKPPAAPPAAPEAAAAARPVTGIAWQSDFETAKTLAAKEKKGVLVYLTPKWFH